MRETTKQTSKLFSKKKMSKRLISRELPTRERPACPPWWSRWSGPSSPWYQIRIRTQPEQNYKDKLIWTRKSSFPRYDLTWADHSSPELIWAHLNSPELMTAHLNEEIGQLRPLLAASSQSIQLADNPLKCSNKKIYIHPIVLTNIDITGCLQSDLQSLIQLCTARIWQSLLLHHLIRQTITCSDNNNLTQKVLTSTQISFYPWQMLRAP